MTSLNSRLKNSITRKSIQKSRLQGAVARVGEIDRPIAVPVQAEVPSQIRNLSKTTIRSTWTLPQRSDPEGNDVADLQPKKQTLLRISIWMQTIARKRFQSLCRIWILAISIHAAAMLIAQRQTDPDRNEVDDDAVAEAVVDEAVAKLRRSRRLATRTTAGTTLQRTTNGRNWTRTTTRWMLRMIDLKKRRLRANDLPQATMTIRNAHVAEEDAREGEVEADPIPRRHQRQAGQRLPTTTTKSGTMARWTTRKALSLAKTVDPESHRESVRPLAESRVAVTVVDAGADAPRNLPTKFRTHQATATFQPGMMPYQV